MKKLYDMVHTEKYKTKEGEQKVKYTNVGSVLQRDDGSMCCNFLGSWINFYEPNRKTQSQHNQSKANGYQPQTVDDNFDSEIPF